MHGGGLERHGRRAAHLQSQFVERGARHKRRDVDRCRRGHHPRRRPDGATAVTFPARTLRKLVLSGRGGDENRTTSSGGRQATAGPGLGLTAVHRHVLSKLQEVRPSCDTRSPRGTCPGPRKSASDVRGRTREDLPRPPVCTTRPPLHETYASPRQAPRRGRASPRPRRWRPMRRSASRSSVSERRVGRVQRGQGLVEEQHRGSDRQRAGDADALRLATGEPVGATVGQFRDTRGGRGTHQRGVAPRPGRRPRRRSPLSTLPRTVVARRYGFWKTAAVRRRSARRSAAVLDLPSSNHELAVGRARARSAPSAACSCRHRSRPSSTCTSPGSSEKSAPRAPASPCHASPRARSGQARHRTSLTARRLPCCWMRVSTRFAPKASPIRMMAKAMATENRPMRVSWTMAPVSTWVCPWMLPPTIITAPTSLMIAPKAAITVASSATLTSRSCRRKPADGRRPAPRSAGAGPASSCCSAANDRPATIGRAITTWAMTIAQVV